MASRLYVIKLTFTSDGSTPNVVDLKPPRYTQWRVIRAVGFHNDTSSRVTHWGYLYENTASFFTETDPAAEAATTRHPLKVAGDGELILRYHTYARWYVDSLGTGKIATVAALVEESDCESE